VTAEAGPRVGFDLDMTLIDSRPGIAATFRALAADTGVYIDADAAVTRLGPPIREELSRWFPVAQVDEMGDRYRALYPVFAIEKTALLPGATEAIAAVHDAGGQVMVITAKFTANAALHLAHCDVDVDVLIGSAWADGKRDALRDHGAVAYVGDHIADMKSARGAGPVVAIGVTTGPCSQDELIAAGADVVLADLRGFPVWLNGAKLLGSEQTPR
jgi:phosphoglycolate phosphatase